jgi:hypothetical protein
VEYISNSLRNNNIIDMKILNPLVPPMDSACNPCGHHRLQIASSLDICKQWLQHSIHENLRGLFVASLGRRHRKLAFHRRPQSR